MTAHLPGPIVQFVHSPYFSVNRSFQLVAHRQANSKHALLAQPCLVCTARGARAARGRPSGRRGQASRTLSIVPPRLGRVCTPHHLLWAFVILQGQQAEACLLLAASRRRSRPCRSRPPPYRTPTPSPLPPEFLTPVRCRRSFVGVCASWRAAVLTAPGLMPPLVLAAPAGAFSYPPGLSFQTDIDHLYFAYTERKEASEHLLGRATRMAELHPQACSVRIEGGDVPVRWIRIRRALQQREPSSFLFRLYLRTRQRKSCSQGNATTVC